MRSIEESERDWTLKVVGLFVGLIVAPYILLKPTFTSTYSGTNFVVGRLPMQEARIIPSESPYVIRIAADVPFTTTINSQVITGTLVPATFPLSYNVIYASKPITLASTATIGGTTVVDKDKIIRFQVQSSTPVLVTVGPTVKARNHIWGWGLVYALIILVMFYQKYGKNLRFRSR